MVKVGFVKLGNIGSAPLIEFLLDERAERQDINVRTVGAGAKMNVEEALEVTKTILDYCPNLAVVVSPNAALPGPSRVREVLKKAEIATLVVSDGPAKKAIEQIEKLDQGYIIVEADAMIGARREFLDPIEMALFNSDIIRVLAVSGAFNMIYAEMDGVIDAFKKGVKPPLPRIVIDKERAIGASGLQNPYARVKAMAAYEMAKAVAKLTVEGCFTVKEKERYTPMVAAAHEMMRAAARLADEAREIEKEGDVVYRAPHYDDGTILQKRSLMEKPRAKEQ